MVSSNAEGFSSASKTERFLFITCFISLVATSFAFMIRVMLMNTWQIEFALSETQKGEIFGAGMWPFGLSIVLFSLVIDRIGYRRSMLFAFACHAASAILMVMAEGYWWLYIASVLNGLAAGTVEAVINPAIASMFPKAKTKMLTILHAGWPGGFVLAGLAILLMGDSIGWQIKAAIILVPVAIYGLMLLKSKFPVNERVAAGVPYRDMLKEAGAVGFLIVIYMVLMEINRVAGLPLAYQGQFFSLPSWPLTILMAVLAGGYLLYTKSLGRGMYIFLLGIMIILAITELGTDTWIKELMTPAMTEMKLNAGWVLVYTATIMMVLRFCISPIVKRLKPLGVLLGSSLFAAAGLYLLAGAEGAIILLWATIYGIGQCFFWPVTLGLVAERFPRGGALTLNAIAGVGMLGVGILGAPLLGYWQDRTVDATLAADPAQMHLLAKKETKSVFGSYRGFDQGKVGVLNAKLALANFMAENPDPTATKEGETLVRTLMDKTKPADGIKPPAKLDAKAKAALKAWDTAYKEPKLQLPYLTSKNLILAGPAKEAAAKTAAVVGEVTTDAKRSAMRRVAIFPCIMAVCYLGLIVYFKRKGGYTAVELAEDGSVAGEHKPSVAEEVADAESTPSE